MSKDEYIEELTARIKSNPNYGRSLKVTFTVIAEELFSLKEQIEDLKKLIKQK